MMESKCKTCRFWEEQSLDGTLLNVGLCKRYPPQGSTLFEWINEAEESNHKIINFVGSWQNRNANDWCGEHCDKTS